MSARASFRPLNAASFVLSALLGVLMVVSGHNLWAVILCHGLYDTVAFIRYATGRSRYAPEKA